MLADAAQVLVQVAGGPGMTLSEVEIVMQELGRHVSDETQILFGTAVDGRLGDRLSVTIISSFAADDDVVPQQAQMPPLSSAPPVPPVWEQPHESPPKIEVEPEPAPVEDFQSPETTPIEEPEPWRSKTCRRLCRISLERVRGCRHARATREPPEESQLPQKRKEYPLKNRCRLNRKFCSSNPSTVVALKKVSRLSSKAKISTSRRICGKRSR